MTNKTKNCLILFLLAFFLPNIVCYAGTPNIRELEINYPPLPKGTTIGPGAPLPNFLKYMFDVGMIVGFTIAIISLFVCGVLYILSNALPSLKAKAKDRLWGTAVGFMLLLLTYLIAVTINPELGFFKLHDMLPPLNASQPAPTMFAGVSLFETNNCPVTGTSSQNYHLSISNLEDKKNKIKSVLLAHAGENNAYIGILYDEINFWGKCQWLDPGNANPGSKCNDVNPFADSISINRYSFSPKGNGVTFYRKSFYREEGGKYHISNSAIAANGIYVLDLKNERFENVPEEEQTCVKWNFKNECLQREPPILGEENISSIKIDGNYIVMLVYLDPENDRPTDYSYSFCQEFPTPDDVNREGPKQIKWEAIRTLTGGNIPNLAIIAPIIR